MRGQNHLPHNVVHGRGLALDRARERGRRDPEILGRVGDDLVALGLRVYELRRGDGGTTTGAAAVCFAASNYAHVSAGRATQRLGIAYANGSGQNMGLWNVFVVTTLKQTGPNHFVIGSCP